MAHHVDSHAGNHQDQGEDEQAETDDDGGQYQRLRQRVGRAGCVASLDEGRAFAEEASGGENPQVDCVTQDHDAQHDALEVAIQEHPQTQTRQASGSDCG